MKDAWLEAVGKAFPSGHAVEGYPLLGGELSGTAAEVPLAPWRLRLSLCSAFEADQLAALLEDVEEVHLHDGAATLAESVGERELFGPSGAWTVVRREEAPLGPLPGEVVVWGGSAGERRERTAVADGMLLKNLALLRAARTEFPEVDRWVVASAVSAQGETEGLIADTLAYWTGAVAGVEVLEVAQRPGEGFETLWARLNICRLLRWEAHLAAPGDALSGAGLFDELATTEESHR